jgi:hypothetical protein
MVTFCTKLTSLYLLVRYFDDVVCVCVCVCVFFLCKNMTRKDLYTINMSFIILISVDAQVFH